MNENALKDRIRNISKERGQTSKECWIKLYLERFLSRLSRSQYSDKLIFKGGFLLSYMLEIGRETSDLDFLLTRMNSQENEIRKAIEEIMTVQSEDDFSFSLFKMEPLEQPHMEYPGYRVTLQITFGSTKENIQIDIGVGDVVEPEHRIIPLYQYKGKPLFDSEISLSVYPIETIFSEKLETVLSKGAANSRMKDYHDLVTLTRQNSLIDETDLKIFSSRTFKNRGTKLSLIQFDEASLETLQKYWAGHLKKLGSATVDLDLPKNIREIIHEINSYLLKIKLIPEITENMPQHQK